MANRRMLIVNADDLGYTEATSEGILHAHAHGIVTSASLMVRRPAARAAVRAAVATGLDDLGLHLDLGEWVFRGGNWEPLYEVVNRTDAVTVAAECRAQLEAFRDLVGRNPTHLDSHQHVHLDEPLRSVAVAMAADLGVPLRHLAPQVSYCGGFYGQSGRGEPAPEQISEAALLALLRQCAADTATEGRPPAVELACHPGFDSTLETMYRDERRMEVDVLCTRGLRKTIGEVGFDLATFDRLSALQPAERSA